jgi:predicted membrane chloride channel (bestrophin family)
MRLTLALVLACILLVYPSVANDDDSPDGGFLGSNATSVWEDETVIWEREVWDNVEITLLSFFFFIYAANWVWAYHTLFGTMGKRAEGLWWMLFKELGLPMIFCVSFSVTAFYHFRAHLCGKLENIRGLDTGMKVMGVSLMFILSRKTAFAYNRWWEGRGHIGTVAMSLRSLGMMASDAVQQTKGEGKEDYMTIMMLLRLYIPVLRQHGRKEIAPGWKISFVQDWKPGPQGEVYITPEGEGLSDELRHDIERCLPNPIISIHAKLGMAVRALLKTAAMNNACEVQVQEDLSRLLSGYHGVDKITRTMMPPFYDLLQRAALWAYVYLLLPYYCPVHPAPVPSPACQHPVNVSDLCVQCLQPAPARSERRQCVCIMLNPRD